jgi:hypothetical protein
MKQSKLMSWLESFINIAVGFGISLAAQMYFLPLLGVNIEFHQNLMFALIMTVISLLRSFVLRRVFEALHIRRPLTPFMQAVIAERFRQIDIEGWDAAHDDTHLAGELAQAGAAYALAMNSVAVRDARLNLSERVSVVIQGFHLWPWTTDWWKAHDPRRNYVKSAALVIAEGERFDRNRKRKG